MASSSEESVGSNSGELITTTTFTRDIYRILKAVHPDLEISRGAILKMDEFINNVLEIISREANNLVENEKRPYIITSREVQTVARLLLPGEVGRNAIVEGNEAVKRFYSNC